MKNRLLFSFILIVCIGCLTSFITKTDYDHMNIIVKGKIINLKTGEPLKNTNIYIQDKIMYEPIDDLDPIFGSGKTNEKGEFIIESFIKKEEKEFWIKSVDFAQINVHASNIDTTKKFDTIDIGMIYLVPYDMELEVEAYNIPKPKLKFRLKKRRLKKSKKSRNLP